MFGQHEHIHGSIPVSAMEENDQMVPWHFNIIVQKVYNAQESINSTVIIHHQHHHLSLLDMVHLSFGGPKKNKNTIAKRKKTETKNQLLCVHFSCSFTGSIVLFECHNDSKVSGHEGSQMLF